MSCSQSCQHVGLAVSGKRMKKSSCVVRGSGLPGLPASEAALGGHVLPSPCRHLRIVRCEARLGK